MVGEGGGEGRSLLGQGLRVQGAEVGNSLMLSIIGVCLCEGHQEGTEY